jgi:transcriptional regulator with XRE-family HTH domain
MSLVLPKIVGRNLRKRREELGLSQEKFAEVLRFHRTYVGALERGERNLSLGSLEHLGSLLDMDPRDLLND